MTAMASDPAPPFSEIQVQEQQQQRRRPSVGLKESSEQFDGLLRTPGDRRESCQSMSSNVPSLSSLSLQGSSMHSTQHSPTSPSTTPLGTYQINGQTIAIDARNSGRRLSSIGPKIDETEILKVAHEDKSKWRSDEEKETSVDKMETAPNTTSSASDLSSVTKKASASQAHSDTSSLDIQRGEPHEDDTVTMASTIATDLTGFAGSSAASDYQLPPPPPEIISPELSAPKDRLNNFFPSKQISLEPPAIPGRKPSGRSNVARQMLGLAPTELEGELNDVEIRKVSSLKIMGQGRWDNNSSGHLDKLPAQGGKSPSMGIRDPRKSATKERPSSSSIAREILGLSPSKMSGKNYNDDEEMELPLKTGSVNKLAGRWDNMSDHSLDSLPRRSRRRPSPKRQSVNARF